MKVLLAATLMALAFSTASAARAPQPLKPDEAAIVGGWSSVWGAVDGIVLQSVAQEGACLRLGDRALLLSDHQTLDTTVIWGPHKLAPGRYAVVGVQWHAPYFDQYGITGVSRQDGDLWVVTVAPGVITDIGVWAITSPYPHRYVLSAPNLVAGEAAARLSAEGLAPLVIATGARTPICPEHSAQ